jgi:hypothetical protein
MTKPLKEFLQSAHALHCMMVRQAYEQVHETIPEHVRNRLQLSARPEYLSGAYGYAFRCLARGLEEFAVGPTREWNGVNLWRRYRDTAFNYECYRFVGAFKDVDSLVAAVMTSIKPHTN